MDSTLPFGLNHCSPSGAPVNSQHVHSLLAFQPLFTSWLSTLPTLLTPEISPSPFSDFSTEFTALGALPHVKSLSLLEVYTLQSQDMRLVWSLHTPATKQVKHD